MKKEKRQLKIKNPNKITKDLIQKIEAEARKYFTKASGAGDKVIFVI